MTQPVELPRRRLARDAQGRIGEVMPPAIPTYLLGSEQTSHVNLRPPGGGKEWSVPREDLEYLEEEQ